MEKLLSYWCGLLSVLMIHIKTYGKLCVKVVMEYKITYTAKIGKLFIRSFEENGDVLLGVKVYPWNDFNLLANNIRKAGLADIVSMQKTSLQEFTEVVNITP